MSAAARLRQLADAAAKERDDDERRYCMACGSGYGEASDAFGRAVDAWELARWCADAAEALELARPYITAATPPGIRHANLLARLEGIVAAGGGST